MAWFIIQTERKTWTKYLVEADNPDDAIDRSDDWQYMGYVDGEDTETMIESCPFASEADAVADESSYVDGVGISVSHYPVGF